MRIVAFDHAGQTGFGLRTGNAVVPLAAWRGHAPSDLAGLLTLDADGRRALQAEADAVPDAARLKLEGLSLRAPLPQGGKVICIGLNYALHAKEGGNPIPDYPAVFLRTASSVIGPGQPMLRPRASAKLDYEAELVFVVGKRARHVPEDRALEHVAAYTCCNEGSVRDFQRKSTQWTVGKNFDATGAFGPELVTADELPAGASGLRIATRLNGQTMQDSTTADMIFPVAKLVSILSEVMTLDPGDVVATGTPSGVGYARNPPVFLQPGDIVEVEIEGIGVLRNPVAAEP